MQKPNRPKNSLLALYYSRAFHLALESSDPWRGRVDLVLRRALRGGCRPSLWQRNALAGMSASSPQW